MPRRSSNNGCGNTLRSVQQATSQSGSYTVNKELNKATDGSLDYSEGQPLYIGSAECDPSRSGTDKPDCCEG